MDSLDVLSTVTRNVAVNPSDPKFRRLRLSNLKVRQAVVDTPGALDSLFTLGWLRDEADPDSLVYPAGRQLTMAQVCNSCSENRQHDNSCDVLKFVRLKRVS